MKAIDRLYEYFTEKSLKPTAVEREIGLSNGYLSAQKKRNADIGESLMNKIIDYFRDINPEWLLTGNGTMLKLECTSKETNVQDCSSNNKRSFSNTNKSNNTMSIEDKLLAIIADKDVVIRDMAEEIGVLKQTITQLRRELGDAVSAANGSTIASVG